MLKITDPDHIRHAAILRDDAAIKITEDHLRIRMIRYDAATPLKLVVVCEFTTADGEGRGLVKEYWFDGEVAANLLDLMDPLIDGLEEAIAAGEGEQPISAVKVPGHPLEKIKDELRAKPKPKPKGLPPRPIIPGVPR